MKCVDLCEVVSKEERMAMAIQVYVVSGDSLPTLGPQIIYIQDHHMI